jgi:hypothetical protein
MEKIASQLNKLPHEIQNSAEFFNQLLLIIAGAALRILPAQAIAANNAKCAIEFNY